MAIKKLQQNYTTPEQSKRLLELGVPAYSADLFYFNLGDGFINLPTLVDDDECVWFFDERFLPCWSVGRLIEIYEMCFGGYFNSRYFGHTLMEDVLLKIEEQIDSIDFSKLED